MGWNAKLRDIRCDKCNKKTETFVSSSTGTDEIVPGIHCECGGDVRVIMGQSYFGEMNDPEKRSIELKRRAKEHSFKEMSKDPERHGFLSSSKPKAWNFRSHKK